MKLPYIDLSLIKEQTVGKLGFRATTCLGALVCYVALCRGLRYLRRDRKHAQLPYKTREDFQKMTAEDAWQIIRYVQSLEFPWMSGKALAFALFKTYGIPSISKLLCDTQQLSNVEYAGRRYTDTSILIIEFLGHSPTSERATSAIARMNYLHSRYQKAKLISNDDMLYTLSLFVLEVERWVRLYEWRTLTPMEICAIGTHWKVIGDAMEIDYSELRHGPTSFKDGLEFFEDMREWADVYERRCMVPNKHNHQLAEETTRILLADVPGPFRLFGKDCVAALMDERLRRAMLYDDPSPAYLKTIEFVFSVRKLFMKYLIPPRPYALRFDPTSDEPDPKTGRYYMSQYDSEPWYVKATFFSRNSPLAWFRWAIGGPYPDGKMYKPEGYKIFEIGPKKLEKSGLGECEATRDRLLSGERGRCPFAFS
ncbi:hypothetical protein P153DRAFT_355128 [Dothidotthia symphoricarpi CBS 119687]|uniref:ER-bound oxygenase mpaB/mpaB'/Rubber oxygenase catalytic domain-containing protein n=1 Tax=Dothidotthia symphoricarpi CBS 119687 TaxID=1392245 RepID=A0A6A6AKB9_9PLEO|nr:uncharacterized protein P153DRAFT_355128 [Dothidotthia symphoricarpi CBS 119687]KAF2131317.1 hypothetical protein P153DRAFT_355128 [Dothidotthia symphoricarpi CBS 119687]